MKKTTNERIIRVATEALADISDMNHCLEASAVALDAIERVKILMASKEVIGEVEVDEDKYTKTSTAYWKSEDIL